MTPLLSVVIPTRNRQKYCIAAIENILSYNYPAMELCVQDNSDDDQIEQYIAARNPDNRLVYRRIPEQIASIFNIGNSLELATGKYIIIIGDDDTILPQIFNTVEWMDKNDIDSVCPSVIIDYFWPGAHPLHSNGWLIVPQQNSMIEKIENVNQRLELLFKRGTIRYLQYNLPKVYHGIVRRKIVEQIKINTGHYAGGLSPDIYMCVALSNLVKTHYIIGYAVTVAGACCHSSSSQNVNKGHRGELSEAPHLTLRGEYQWDSLVPQYYGIDTIWAESALKAVQEMRIPKLRNLFNYYYMATYALIYNRSIYKIAIKRTLSTSRELGKTRTETILMIIANVMKILTVHCFQKVKRVFIKKQEPQFFDNISDISVAVSRVGTI